MIYHKNYQIGTVLRVLVSDHPFGDEYIIFSKPWLDPFLGTIFWAKNILNGNRITVTYNTKIV